MFICEVLPCNTAAQTADLPKGKASFRPFDFGRIVLDQNRDRRSGRNGVIAMPKGTSAGLGGICHQIGAERGIDFTTVWTTVLVMRPPHRVGLVTLREMRSAGVRGPPHLSPM